MTKYIKFFLLCVMIVHWAIPSLTANEYPKLVVFGFDKTLWPMTIGFDAFPPFQKLNISVFNSDIIDARGRVVKVFPEANTVLSYLYKNNIRMATAAKTKESDGTRQLCTMFGWNKYFVSKMIYPCSNKDEQIIRISQRSRVRLNEILFFDDQQSNVNDVEHAGVVSYVVPHGMTMNDLLNGLSKYTDRYANPHKRKIEPKIPI